MDFIEACLDANAIVDKEQYIIQMEASVDNISSPFEASEIAVTDSLIEYVEEPQSRPIESIEKPEQE